MKAAFNGVPNLSVLDGWWIEGCIEGITGWTIGDGTDGSSQAEAELLYHKLGHVFPAMFHEERGRWIAVMKGASSKNAAFFNSQRMMRRYAADAYIRKQQKPLSPRKQCRTVSQGAGHRRSLI
jgi:glycogen phosphorylase